MQRLSHVKHLHSSFTNNGAYSVEWNVVLCELVRKTFRCLLRFAQSTFPFSQESLNGSIRALVLNLWLHTALAAPLLAAYQTRLGRGLGALVLEIFTKTPPEPCFLMTGTATFALWYKLLTLMRIRRSNSCSASSIEDCQPGKQGYINQHLHLVHREWTYNCLIDNTSIIHDNIELAELGQCPVHGLLPICLDRHVALDKDCSTLRLRGGDPLAIFSVDVDQQHFSPFLDELFGDSLAKAKACASDDGDFSRESESSHCDIRKIYCCLLQMFCISYGGIELPIPLHISGMVLKVPAFHLRIAGLRDNRGKWRLQASTWASRR